MHCKSKFDPDMTPLRRFGYSMYCGRGSNGGRAVIQSSSRSVSFQSVDYLRVSVTFARYTQRAIVGVTTMHTPTHASTQVCLITDENQGP